MTKRPRMLLKGRDEDGEVVWLMQFWDGVFHFNVNVGPSHLIAALEGALSGANNPTSTATETIHEAISLCRRLPRDVTADAERARLRQIRADAIAAARRLDYERAKVLAEEASASWLFDAVRSGACPSAFDRWDVHPTVDCEHLHNGQRYQCTVWDRVEWNLKHDAARGVADFSVKVGPRCMSDMGELHDRNLIAA